MTSVNEFTPESTEDAPQKKRGRPRKAKVEPTGSQENSPDAGLRDLELGGGNGAGSGTSAGDYGPGAPSTQRANVDHISEDPFDPDREKRRAQISPPRLITRVNYVVQKPGKQAYITVHPDPEMEVEVCLVKDEDSGRFYLVHPDLENDPALVDSLKRFLLYPYKFLKGGAIGLWPIGYARDGETIYEAHLDARKAAGDMRGQWAKLGWDAVARTYTVQYPVVEHPLPNWSDVDRSTLLREAFSGDRLVDSRDHRVYRLLAGA